MRSSASFNSTAQSSRGPIPHCCQVLPRTFRESGVTALCIWRDRGLDPHVCGCVQRIPPRFHTRGANSIADSTFSFPIVPNGKERSGSAAGQMEIQMYPKKTHPDDSIDIDQVHEAPTLVNFCQILRAIQPLEVVDPGVYVRYSVLSAVVKMT